MYLSRLILNPRSHDVRRDLANCQAMHRTILAAFPQVPEPENAVAGAPRPDAREHFGVLHRVDVDERTGCIALLVQSHAEPDWSHLPERYTLTSGAAGVDVKPVGDAYRRLQNGMTLAFRLRANPTRKIDTKSGPDGRRRNGKRVDLRTDEDRARWLARKGEMGGFRLLSVDSRRPVEILPPAAPGESPSLSGTPDVRVGTQSRLWGQRGWTQRRPAPESSAGHRLTFASVLFEGVLEVTDAERFRQALEQGIGSAKAYGFGLLSIAPASARTALAGAARA